MKFVVAAAWLSVLVALGSCSQPQPVQVVERGAVPEKKASPPAQSPPDYTKDWRPIAALAGRQEYPEYGKLERDLWRRRNWNMTVSGEWVDDLVEDMQRRFRWDKKLGDWVAEKGNPDWPR